ncbi:IclR family transcriptional regulator [Raineyella sp. LH-20]|uniref:IclR family transcriptional regulator n=1 Tax=Raineyella sp. LH-20 TaxID=3081204 RepID=UPI0029536101|nr:IclR family transcriptional regulator [Raineyella sp. LH-20]WOP19638.1 IclR family transcriptional regulator [Raineyella sp. LH-20]
MSNLSRAIEVLELMADEPDGVRVSDVATTMGLNRAIPFRLLTELVQLGYAIQDPDSERYRATFALGSLGLRQLESSGIVDWSQDELGALARSSGELVRLAMVSDHRLRFVAQAQGANSSLIVHSPLRPELALGATASGKAYLSTLPEATVREIVTERGLEAFTNRTITSLDALLDELVLTRQRGYAVVVEEMEVGVNAGAAPIISGNGGSGQAVGTISIAGPSVRLSRERIEELSDDLVTTATRLGKQWNVYRYLQASR